TVADLDVGELVWLEPVGVLALASGLGKTGGASAWDAGTASTQMLDTGYVEITISETTTRRAFGLGAASSVGSLTDIAYAIVLSGSIVQVYEAGVFKGSFGPSVTGDRLRVAISGGTVKYYKNGASFYASATAPSLPLRVGTSFFDPGATLLDVVVSDAVTPDPVLTCPTVIAPGRDYAATVYGGAASN